jgi:hypothetical protein
VGNETGLALGINFTLGVVMGIPIEYAHNMSGALVTGAVAMAATGAY